MRTLALALVLTASASAGAPAQAPGAAAMVEALVLDFRQNPYDGPQAPIAALYQKACDGGYAPACDYRKWHHASESHLVEAVEALRPACDKGDPLACLVVAWRLESFSSDDSEAKIATAPEAVALYQRSCDAGLSRACTDLAWMYYYGEGMADDDWGRAFSLRTQACDAGEPRACDDLADMYLMGQGADVDKARAATLRQKGCDGGVAAACDALGDTYRSGQGVPIDFVKAAALFQRSCDGWYAGGCNHLAQAYEEGQGVPKSKEKADSLHYTGCGMWREASCLRLDAEVRAEIDRTKDASLEGKFLDKVCDPSRPGACGQLGNSYDGQAHDEAGHARAVKVWERACALGEQNSCLNLGTALSRGEGVPEDDARANALWVTACEAGERVACQNLARGLQGGCGGGQPAKSMELYTRACDHGESPACADLGRRYETGDIVAKDLVKARALYTKGCDRFDGDSCARLGRMIEDEDPSGAASLYAKSCVEGSELGCVSQGEALVSGLGGTTDAFVAADGWRRACEADGSRGEGCVRLASLYFEGVGTRKGTSEGVNLLVDGCRRGSALACDRLWLGKVYGLYPGVDAARAEAARKQGCALRGIAACPDAPTALSAANGFVSGKAPAIPGSAAKRGLTAGVCVLELDVEASGKVKGSRVAECEPGLVADSQKAVRSWKFAPGAERGVDVRLVFQQGSPTRTELTDAPETAPCARPTGF